MTTPGPHPVGHFSNRGRYLIRHSAKFDGLAYLERTFGAADSRQVQTLSMWVRMDYTRTRGTRNVTTSLFESASAADNYGTVRFNAASTDPLQVYEYQLSTVNANHLSGLNFRDVTGWYHLVVQYNTNSPSAADRIRVYINGRQVTDWQTDIQISQFANTMISGPWLHRLGSRAHTSPANRHNGYMAEVIYVDGESHGPGAFGEWSRDNPAAWVPKRYTGNFGAEGFHLDFSDALNLGKDVSGNGNDWTNVAGVGQADVTPTNNNDLWHPEAYDGQYVATYSSGNSKATTSVATGTATHRGSLGLVPGGKYYCEFQLDGGNPQGQTAFGFSTSSFGGKVTGNIDDGIAYRQDGDIRINGVNSAHGAGFAVGNRLACVIDLVGNTIEFFVSNVSQGAPTALPANMIGVPVYLAAAARSATGSDYLTWTILTELRTIGYASRLASEGAVLPIESELPAPPVKSGRELQYVTEYVGDGQDNRTVLGAGFQPDSSEIKRDASGNRWHWEDSDRGPAVGSNDAIVAHNYDFTEATNTSAGTSVKAFEADGLRLGTSVNVNATSALYVATMLKEAAGFFEVMTYQGNGVEGRTLPHNLGVEPEVVIVKARDVQVSWRVHFKSLGITQPLLLDTNGSASSGNQFLTADPDATNLYVKNSSPVNANGVEYVAYLFGRLRGVCVPFWYTGNGQANGPYIDLGGRPSRVWLKNRSGTNHWVQTWLGAGPGNPTQEVTLNLDSNFASQGGCDLCAMGIKIRTSNSKWNANGQEIHGFALVETDATLTGAN